MLRTLICVAGALAVSSAVQAAPPKAATKAAPPAKAAAATKAAPAAKAPPKATKKDLDRWRQSLELGNEAQLESTLTEIAALGPDGTVAAPLVDALLARGASTKVLLAAFDAEGKLRAQASSDAVAPYVAHRSPEIRRAAARALVLTGGPVAVTGLRRALSGPDPAVRGVAAGGLGTLGASDSVEDLFTVLSHDTPEAAVAIAMLCSPEQCDRLMALVGKLKFEVLEPSFVPLLLRPSTVLPDANKLRYIDRLRRLATKPAAAVLTAALNRIPEDENLTIRAALQAALKARPVVGDSK